MTLNNKEKQILLYIQEYIENKNYSPSIREIVKAVGINSTSIISEYLDKLMSKGYLVREINKPRTIKLLKDIT